MLCYNITHRNLLDACQLKKIRFLPSIFVAGVRPAIMWICVLGLATQFHHADRQVGNSDMVAANQTSKISNRRTDDFNALTFGGLLA